MGLQWGTALSDVFRDDKVRSLAKLSIETVGDLLRHYPRRYQDTGTFTDLSMLREGDDVTVLAEVRSVRTIPYRGRKGSRVEAIVGDDAGHTLTLTWFNQSWRASQLKVGMRALCAGEVSTFRGNPQLTVPDFSPLDALGNPTRGAAAQRLSRRLGRSLIPVYPATRDLRSWEIEDLVAAVLDQLSLREQLVDPLPAHVRLREGLSDLATAINGIHRPSDRAQVESARRRLTWDEAFLMQAELARRRQRAARWPSVPRVAGGDGLLAEFDRRLPFELTEGQREVSDVILTELGQPHPMMRLLQGEVGSGKTIVALRAMLAVVESGGQAALLAPTEVLAQQHAHTIRGQLGDLGRAGELDGSPLATRVVLLTGSTGAAKRREHLEEIRTGVAGLVVGTHALLQDDVAFGDLGLVVVDEQHRFGVEQRDALRWRSEAPAHVLVMTATPIPRTVAMTVFGDLQTSVLRQLPAGRSPVSTSVVPTTEKPSWFDRMWERVQEEVAAGRQVYVVCSRIGDDEGGVGPLDRTVAGDPDASEDGNASAVSDVVATHEWLREMVLPDLRVGLLHGRMTAEDKESRMAAFSAGDLDVLVATTVIEVGVDVPNATMMVILDADRFGASQLHQLRGRVGRGDAPGICLMETCAPEGSPARERLTAVAGTSDGFEVARYDLAHRREGDVLGALQAGSQRYLKLLSLIEHAAVIADARDEASALVASDPDLVDHPVLAEALERVLGAGRSDYLDKA